MSKQKLKNIVIVGLGPHARRIYYPFLEELKDTYDLNIQLIVDMQNQKSKIENYIEGRLLKPNSFYWVKDTNQMVLGEYIEESLIARLKTLISENQIDGVIIATEPKAHRVYLEWFLRNNIDILMDKPITAPTGLTSATKDLIYKDYCEISEIANKSSSKFVIQCQRRYHAGYKLIWDYVNEFVEKWEIPITYISAYHSDGMWNMPDELVYRENHPYKYGYGKLMHSGYHFVDLIAWFTKINNRFFPIDSYEIDAFGYYPKDFTGYINNSLYKKVFNKYYEELDKQDYTQFGELDCYTTGQFRDKEGKTISTFVTNLLQNSFSRRAWADLPEDAYKGNGRVRHEHFNLQVSHLLNIQVHSYQAYEVKRDMGRKNSGGVHHFDIHFYHNSDIVGEDPYKKLDLGNILNEKNNNKHYLGHNEEARKKCIMDWLCRKEGNSSFASHRLTNKLMGSYYVSLVKNSRIKEKYDI